jgi:hypothetical protein
MNERAEECKGRALECERAARDLFATDLALCDLLLDLARRWREMAKEVQHQNHVGLAEEREIAPRV